MPSLLSMTKTKEAPGELTTRPLTSDAWDAFGWCEYGTPDELPSRWTNGTRSLSEQAGSPTPAPRARTIA
ncbi:MAG: hypothetical protein ACRDP1_09765 [Nocardioidaceae bacterium]